MPHVKNIVPAFLLLFTLVFHGRGQVNIVPNFGFEQYSNCPTTGDQVQYCDGWSKYSNNISTPDYYNECSSSSSMGVPQSIFTYQPDHRGCGGYVGLVTWTSNPNEREHVGIQLSQPLVIGQKYYLSYYAVMAGSDDGSFYYESPSNNIGMRLSTVPFSSSTPTPIDNYAHLRSTSIISDTANWVRIFGSMIADSAYQYLVLGNFYDDTNTDTLTLSCGNCLNNYSYYFVDDVCISTDSVFCDGGIDVLPCNVSVEEVNLESYFTVYPNPVNDILFIQGKHNYPYDIEIFNSIGQLVYHKEWINLNHYQVDLSEIDTGLLFVKISSDNNQVVYKILKQ